MVRYGRKDVRSRQEHLYVWAVVLVSHNERDCWFSHFFETRELAEAYIAKSKAPLHAMSLRLYQLVA